MSQRDVPAEPLPERDLNGNQLVAYNVAHWRKALGITQQELADRMNWRSYRGPWSKVKVSALERSVHGTRPALVPADDLVNLAEVLEVPLLGLFLPPVDDGVKAVYRLGVTSEGGFLAMDQLVARLFPPVDSDDVNIGAYYDRVEQTLRHYFGTVELNLVRSGDPSPDPRSKIAVLAKQRDTLLEILRSLSGQIEQLQDLAAQSERAQKDQGGQP